MPRVIQAVVFALVAGGSLVAAQSAAIRSRADVVQVDVVALDGGGSPVAGLGKSDFDLRIDGRPVPIETFAAVTSADAGRLMVLLLDDLTVEPTLAGRVKSIARDFVGKMGRGDELAVLRFDADSANHNGFWSKPTASAKTTTDSRALLEQIDQFRYRGPVLNSYHIGEYLLETIGYLSSQLAAAPGRRKSIVCLGSDGLFDVREPGPGPATKLRPEWLEAVRAAAAANVSVYVIDPFGLRRQADSRATGFARQTGGHAFVNNFFEQSADRIWRESGTYYLLGFEASHAAAGGALREIDVQVARRDVEIKARRKVALP